jgi:hypothetical protein
MVIRMNAFTPVPSPEDASSMSSGMPADAAAMTRAVEQLANAKRRSTTEMLQELRRAFPHSPLAVRVRALEALRKR